MKEVKIEIDKDAFSGPFECHKAKTKLISKKITVNGNSFSYSVWQCPKCKEEYLDNEQARRMEAIWTFEKLLNDKVVTMKRSVNFDGKMFFLRFPKEVTNKWTKDKCAEIKVIDTSKFIVEVKDF